MDGADAAEFVLAGAAWRWARQNFIRPRALDVLAGLERYVEETGLSYAELIGSAPASNCETGTYPAGGEPGKVWPKRADSRRGAAWRRRGRQRRTQHRGAGRAGIWILLIAALFLRGKVLYVMLYASVATYFLSRYIANRSFAALQFTRDLS